MIYVLLEGNLGNAMFEIAAAVSLTDEVVLCLKYPSQWDMIRKYEHTIFKGFKIVEGCPPHVKQYKESVFSYSPIPYRQGEDLLLDGFFQSEKYFVPEKVRQCFSVPESIERTIREQFGELLSQGVTSIHVRRGDYLKIPHRHPFCGETYYRDAIRRIGEDRPFLFVSDDIPWCKRHFKGDNYHFAEGTSPLVDLYLQSQCKNNIISNSSFSWWGAWLNVNPGKVVIAPSLWFGLGYRHLDTKDILPEGTVIVSNRYSTTQYLQARSLLLKETVGKTVRRFLKR